MDKDTQGNPKTVEDTVLGSKSDDFFTALEDNVNSLVSEGDSPEASTTETPQQDPVTQQQAKPGTLESEVNNLKKRYSDSSREAQSLRAQLNELKPFVPVLDAMKQDSGLVNHVRDYFQQGGEVNKDVKSQLGLSEDFEFNSDDMVNDPNSDSAKVFNNMVDKVVQQRAGEIIQHQNQEDAAVEHNRKLDAQAMNFIKEKGLTAQEFASFVQEAQHKFSTEGMSFDDMWLIVNKNQAAQNVANSTKQDMLNQMKGVRNIPTSQGASNNAGAPVSGTDAAFDALLNSDGNIEELLG